MTRSTGFAAERREMRSLALYRCTCCKRTKHASDFHKSIGARWGLQASCKDCAAVYIRARTAKIQEARAVRLSLVDNTIKACNRCGETKAVEHFRLRTEAGRTHQHYSTCNDCWKGKGKEWRDANPERARHLVRAWFAKDPERSRAIYRKAQRVRMANPIKRLHARIATQIWHSIKGKKGGRSSESLLGYTFDELGAHLERQFLRGMSWENMGEWHIDHILPLASFTIAGPDDPELRRAWSLPNLRPLWAADNIRKSDNRETLL